MNNPVLTFRPIDAWPGGLTAERRTSPFQAAYASTLDLLDRELWNLGARDVVLMLALPESQIRADGLPRARATPSHPGVILAFHSAYGPLKYATDVFLDWHSNLRAIALGLEALRKVDRYGITKRGEQYTGWKALPAGVEAVMSAEEAARVVAAEAGGALAWPLVLNEPARATEAYRAAVKRVHPDVGGTTKQFLRLQEAKRVLDTYHG